MPHLHLWLLTLADQRRERIEACRAVGKGPGKPAVPARVSLCLFCRGRLTNGSAVCSEACDQGWWNVVPTEDGELFIPAPSSVGTTFRPDRRPRCRPQSRSSTARGRTA